MKSDKINLNQMTNLMVLFIFGGTVLANMGAQAGQNVWIVYLIGSFLGTLMYLMFYRVSALHGHAGLLQIFINCFGQLAGRLFMIIMSCFWLFRNLVMGNSLSTMAESLLMINASHRLVIAILLVAVVYAVHSGISVIARGAEIFLLLLVFFLIPFFLSTINPTIFTATNLLPILSEGIGGILLPSLRLAMFPFSETFIFLMIFPYVQNQHHKKILKRGIIAIWIAAILLMGIEVINVAILGINLAQKLQFPFYNAMQLSEIPGLIDRLDPLAAVIIIFPGYYKTVLFLYVAVLGLSGLSKKVKFRTVLTVIWAIIFIMAPYSNFFNSYFLLTILPLRLLPVFSFFVPMVLWFISEYKHYRRGTI